MECPICVADLGDQAYCLPCGHIYCIECIKKLPQRHRLIECSFCRKSVLSRIGPDTVRKIFLDPSSPKAQTLQARLEAAEKERDKALLDLGRLTSIKFDPFFQALNAKDTLLEIKNKELEQLKSELAKVKNVVLPEKERQIREMTENLSHVTKKHQEEVSQHRKVRGELEAQDAEITKLKEAVTSFSPQAQTGAWINLSNFLYDIKGALSLGLTSPPPIKMEPASSFELEDTRSISSASRSPSPRVPSTPTFTSSPRFSSASRADSSPTDPDTTLVDIPEFALRYRGSSSHSNSSGSIAGSSFSQVKVQTASSVHSSQQTATQVVKVKPKALKEKVLKRGNEIRWEGYGCPRYTSVPECTAKDGCHKFSGKGTNGYAKRYTCTVCHFSCSESPR